MFIAYPVFGQLYAQKKQKLLMDTLYSTNIINKNLEEASLEAESQYNDLKKVFDENLENTDKEKQNLPDEPIPGSSAVPLVLPNSIKATEKPALVYGQVLGRMLIEKINVDIPIVEGASAENLEISLGHLPGSSLIGEIGNTAIAGHRSHSYGYYFNRLDEMDVNDVIIIDTGEKTYKYIVYEKKVVEPTDLSVLNRSKKHSILTLITCHPLYSSKQRLIVHAYLDAS